LVTAVVVQEKVAVAALIVDHLEVARETSVLVVALAVVQEMVLDLVEDLRVSSPVSHQVDLPETAKT
jgi:hypothetical protein